MPTVPGIFPAGAKILFVGQAPGTEEVRRGQPFVGASGRELNRWLAAAEIDRSQCALTNVWLEPIPAGGLVEMTAPTAQAKAFANGLKPIQTGRWLRPEWQSALPRLHDEIRAASPNIVVALGDQALWALSGTAGISARRGTLFRSLAGPKALATYHPAAILRGGYRLRPLAIADMLKAKRVSETPEMVLPERSLWLSPTLGDLEHFENTYLRSASLIAIDIETGGGEITSIAFAPSPYLAICVPFVLNGKSYWPDVANEASAWRWVERICASHVPKVLQNGLYDAQWLWVLRRIAIRNYLHDTRLAHHALFPELPKSLGFMGALWENEIAWKGMRNAKQDK